MPENETAVFLLKGKSLLREDAIKAPIMALGADEQDANIVHVFDEDTLFVQWLSKHDYGDKVMAMLKKVQAESNNANIDRTLLEQKQKFEVERIAKELVELGKRTGLDMGSEEFFKRATAPEDPTETAIFDPLVLCDSPQPNCAIPLVNLLPLGGGVWQDLRWFKWNDRARSYRVSGQAMLYEHINFVGRSVFLVGHPVWGDGLARYGFDRIASSAWVL